MQNVHVLSRSVFHFLSNGALFFAVSLILCTGKIDAAIRRDCACIQPPFSANITNLQENQVHHSKDREIKV
jgi:hypothetical protein